MQGLAPGKAKSRIAAQAGICLDGEHFVEKALDVPVDNKFRMSDQCAAGCWAAPTRASSAETGNSSYHSTVPAEWNSRARSDPSMQYYECQAWLYKRCGLAGQIPKGSHKDEQRRGEPDMWEKAERTGRVQP